MRHQKRGYKLGRTHAHRQATLASLSSALIAHKRIRTTFTKAKALRQYVEPLISRAKEDTTHNRRQVFRRLQDKEAIKVLFSEISEKIGDRPGGYTRIVKLGQRAGDGAEMAIIELVDFNEADAEATTTSRRRRTRRGGSGSGGRRQSKKQTDASKKQTAAAGATTTAVETEDQVVGDDVALDQPPTETVEEPVADEVTEPVEARTDDTPAGVEEEVVTDEADTAEAEAPAAEAEAETEAETEAEAPAAEAEAPAEDAADEPEAKADDTDDAEDKEK